MDRKSPIKVCLLVVLIFLIFIPANVIAKKNGVTDRDLSIDAQGQGGQGACGISCHQAAQAGASISISANPCCSYTPGQTGINITATTSGMGSVDTIQGIMILNNAQPYNLNIKDDGWIIEKDPNNNAKPDAKNYNQKTGLSTLDQTFSWTVTAPNTTGTYYVLAHARYGLGPGNKDDRNASSTAITITVQSAIPEFPSSQAAVLIPTLLIYYLIGKKEMK